MPQVTINQAQRKLSQLIRKVLAGEEVVIVKGKMPCAGYLREISPFSLTAKFSKAR
jgi:hypothetical protein